MNSVPTETEQLESPFFADTSSFNFFSLANAAWSERIKSWKRRCLKAYLSDVKFMINNFVHRLHGLFQDLTTRHQPLRSLVIPHLRHRRVSWIYLLRVTVCQELESNSICGEETQVEQTLKFIIILWPKSRARPLIGFPSTNSTWRTI